MTYLRVFTSKKQNKKTDEKKLKYIIGVELTLL